MNGVFNPIVFVVGLVLSPLAALMAFFITYDEYLRHYPDKGTPRRIALQTAIGTLIFFLLLSAAVAWFLGRALY